MKTTVTINQLKEMRACKAGLARLRRYVKPMYGDDDPIHVLTVLEANGPSDALWLLRRINKEATELVEAHPGRLWLWRRKRWAKEITWAIMEIEAREAQS